MVDYTDTFDLLREASQKDNKKTYIDILEELKADPITTTYNYPTQVEAALDYVIDKLKLRNEFKDKPTTFEELDRLYVEFHEGRRMGD